MKKVIITSILCICLITIGVSPVFGASGNTELKDKIITVENIVNILDEEPDPYVYFTSGPVSTKYSDVEIMNGSAEEISSIERSLNREFPRLSMFLPYVFTFITEPMDFIVRYDTNMENGSRYSYFTFSGNATYDESGELIDINETLDYNTIHTLKVENFTGIFFFFRAQLYRSRLFYLRPLFSALFYIVNFGFTKSLFIPARFSFIGTCDNITQLPVIK